MYGCMDTDRETDRQICRDWKELEWTGWMDKVTQKQKGDFGNNYRSISFFFLCIYERFVI